MLKMFSFLVPFIIISMVFGGCRNSSGPIIDQEEIGGDVDRNPNLNNDDVNSTDDTNETNQSTTIKVPIVSAGTDKNVEINSTIILVGSATNGPITKYSWIENNQSIGTTATLNYTPTTLGAHNLTLTATNSHDMNASDNIVVTTVDTTSPIITLNGANVIHIDRDTNYTDKGVVVVDNSGENITIVTTGEVNTSKLGVYILSYSGVDSSGNSVEANRTVEVLYNYGTITGTVKRSDGNPVGGAIITVGNKSVQTNAQGYFAFDKIAANERAIVKIESNGFVKTVEVSTVRVGANDDLEVVLANSGNEHLLDPTQDINLTVNGASLFIPKNSLVKQDGTQLDTKVKLRVTPLGIDDLPSEAVVNDGSNGISTLLQLLGALDVSIVDEVGNKVDLASGASATIGIPVLAGLDIAIPDDIKLWYFNPETAKPEVAGDISKVGSMYIATVTHFSLYYVGRFVVTPQLTGKLMNCSTTPHVPIVCGKVSVISSQARAHDGEVLIIGHDQDRCTKDDGSFSLNWLENGLMVNGVIQGSKNSIKSTPYTFNALASGETKDVGEVCLNTPRIRITLTWGENPSDLDSHTTFGGEMVYYDHQSSNDNTISLDTDDTSGFGPEITTINSLKNGTYRYSVKHYSGTGKISTSGAVLNMVVDANGDGNTRIRRLTPPIIDGADEDVWIAWDIIVEDDKIKEIKPIQIYGTESDFAPTN